MVQIDKANFKEKFFLKCLFFSIFQLYVCCALRCIPLNLQKNVLYIIEELVFTLKTVKKVRLKSTSPGRFRTHDPSIIRHAHYHHTITTAQPKKNERWSAGTDKMANIIRKQCLLIIFKVYYIIL